MLKVISPATETVITELTEDTPQTIHDKYLIAKKAQKIWAQSDFDTRQKPIAEFSNLLLKHKARLAQTLTQEMGKPISQALAEIEATPHRIDYFIGQTESVIDEKIQLDIPDKFQEKITYDPLGVIANISAWNYPYFVGANVFIPALLSGNAVLYKPSEFAAMTGLALAELFDEAGLPPGLFQTVLGAGPVGEALLKEKINGVFFTGSFATGQKINQAVSADIMTVNLELGGKDPAYVCDDLNPEALKSAAQSVAWGAFYNAGQSCCAIERVYVHEKVYETFVKHFVDTVKGFKVGDPLKTETTIGPLARKMQLKTLKDQVDDALKKGAKIKCGSGKRLSIPGYFFDPTVLVDTNHDMKIMREESFGPVIGIKRVKTDSEAIKLMNDTSYGLTAAVFCGDEPRAKEILSPINSGTVYWNTCDRVSPQLPWSGRNQSGIGATLSHHGISAFVRPKAWHLKRVRRN